MKNLLFFITGAAIGSVVTWKLIEKKYKEAARLMLYGILVVGLPIVFFLDEFRADPASISTGFISVYSIEARI